jgi:hypothetical protein
MDAALPSPDGPPVADALVAEALNSTDTSTGAPDSGADGAGTTIGHYGGLNGDLLKCTTPVPAVFRWDANDKGVGNAVECDWPQTSIDFEEPSRLNKTLAPGPWQITRWGKAFTKSEVNGCHPYCYDRALVVGIDIVGDGTAEASRGEVLIDYPSPPAPFSPKSTEPKGMLLAWFFIEGPAGTPLTVQLEARNQAGNVALFPPQGQATGPGTWLEFKAFPLSQAFSVAALTDLTGIGVKVWANPPLPGGKEWHGRINIDHIEISDRLTGVAGP